jgi:hypothetical protein
MQLRWAMYIWCDDSRLTDQISYVTSFDSDFTSNINIALGLNNPHPHAACTAKHSGRGWKRVHRFVPLSEVSLPSSNIVRHRICSL